MIYNATTNERNLFLFFFFLLLLYFRLFSPVDEFVSLYVREKKRLRQRFLGFTKCVRGGESQNVGTVDIFTKTAFDFSQVEKEPEVKAVDPIIFRNN